MKKFIVFLAVIAIFALAFNAFDNALSGNLPDDITDVITDTVLDDTKEPGSTKPSTDTNKPSTDTSSSVTESSYKYTYLVNIYKQGSSTKLGDIELESNNNTATLRISGNAINLDAVDKIAAIQFTDFKSVDSLSVTTVSPGTTSVYITYTEKSSSSHTHSYTVTKAATCTASGTETCSCGETQTIEALGHKYASLSCGNNPCTRCNENYYISHEWGENVVFIEPTCTEAGTGGCVCRLCGVEDRSIYLNPTGHSYTTTKAATCTSTGTKKCSCGETQTIAALGHEWGEDVVFVNPTCTQAGTGGCVCRLCGVEDRSLYLSPTGHSYTNGICKNCGHSNGTGGCITCGDSSVVTSCSTCGKSLGRYCMDHQSYGSYCSEECAG